METLEIELAYLQELLDDDIGRVLNQYLEWEALTNCSELFDLDVGHIQNPLDVLPDMVMLKADQRLSEGQAERFKAVWQRFTPEQQMHIIFRAFEHS
ncbi:hypothetical protein C7964_103817 [Loktanella sp. PT4BL]|jgi:hypothetical protein|uniref:hypothetical protein n=1 Tax=Loktanella sp. PT4BL TaxID=2135611 RepID=UPI000D756F42|nr:hypothetical protein [Loktanella sp. PT4BL]PXW69297.1 hypothetical protein C7964_103817 [Loktanella sp. PT4BL]